MIKTYQSIDFMKLVITVELNSNPMECLFTGGRTHPFRENGTFRTADAKVIEQLEKHEQFNKQFILLKAVEEPKEEAIQEVKTNVESDSKIENKDSNADPDNQDEITQKPADPEVTDNGTIVVQEVKNSQQAKLYLNKHFGVPFSRLNNVENVVKESRLANLSFPNWIIK